MVDPECIPATYMARLCSCARCVCHKMSSSDACGSDPLVGKPPLVVSPQIMLVAGGDGGSCKAGTGENLPEMPEDERLSKAIVLESRYVESESGVGVRRNFRWSRSR
jgi:hypothetical protein